MFHPRGFCYIFPICDRSLFLCAVVPIQQAFQQIKTAATAIARVARIARIAIACVAAVRFAAVAVTIARAGGACAAVAAAEDPVQEATYAAAACSCSAVAIACAAIACAAVCPGAARARAAVATRVAASHDAIQQSANSTIVGLGRASGQLEAYAEPLILVQQTAGCLGKTHTAYVGYR